jgi:hypothetical protein
MDYKEKQRYLLAWRIYRKLIITAYASVPVFLMLLWLNEVIGLMHPSVVIIFFLCVAIYAFVQMLQWPCPRCGTKLNGFFGSPLRKLQCRSCGLRRFEIPE